MRAACAPRAPCPAPGLLTAVQAGGGFVEEQEAGAGEQLEGHAQPLALAAADALAQRVAHQGVPVVQMSSHSSWGPGLRGRACRE